MASATTTSWPSSSNSRATHSLIVEASKRILPFGRSAKNCRSRSRSVRCPGQRLRRHDFEPQSVVAVRIHVEATNGSENASVYEVRCYG